MTLALHGEIAPYQQEEQVDVVDLGTNQMAARVFIAETDKNCGILLESDARTPFAFLDTSGAVGPPGQAPPARRQISLCRASPNHFDFAGAPFGTIQAATGSGGASVVTVQRGGHVFCTVHVDSGGQGRVVDERGAVLATCEAAGPRQRTLRVAQHADYGLMLSAMVGALKLQG